MIATAAALAVLLSTVVFVDGSFDGIVGYVPASLVTDYAALDQDQNWIEEFLSEGNENTFTSARIIYEDGAHSGSFAMLKLTQAPDRTIPKGSRVTGVREGDEAEGIYGEVMEDLPAGQTLLKVVYNVGSVQAAHQDCIVGGLGQDDALFEADANTFGCFLPAGNVTVRDVTYSYTYSLNTDNDNFRTLKSLSTQAQTNYYDCGDVGGGCPYVDYAKFYEYYGRTGNYADRFVIGAFDKKLVSFGAPEGRGEIDFTGVTDLPRIEAIKKGSAYMSVFMAIIGQLELALDECVEDRRTGNGESLLAWDAGVALYAGSLEGKGTGGDTAGKFMYRLAEKRCVNFRTCGEFANEEAGTSYVNIELLREFSIGQEHVKFGECALARKKKERIVSLMSIPLIQGTLRYAHISAETPAVATNKGRMEGHIFAAAVLPLVHACNERDAAYIESQMSFNGAGATEYDDVQYSFQRNYKCMGIKCSEVGGIWDAGEGRYKSLAKPCSDGTDINVLAIALPISILFVLFCLVICYLFCRPKKGRSFKQDIDAGTFSAGTKSNGTSTSAPPPESPIAAAAAGGDDDDGPEIL